MSAISYQDQTFSMEPGETVLDALLRAKQDVSYSCQSGICQSCVMVCEEGDVPLVAQKGLKDSQKSMNYFLSCQCKPETPLKVASVDQKKLTIPGKVTSKEWLNDHVIGLRIAVDMDFHPGQYVTLWNEDNVGRSYSIASLPEEGFIECHIKVIENGAFSQWLKNEVQVGQTIGVQGPMGLCFYQGEGTEPMLLAAIGTGLAPIVGVLKDALKNGHSGDIHLVVGAKESTGFYKEAWLKEMAEWHSKLTLHWVCQQAPEGASHEGIMEGDIYDYVNTHFTSTKGYKTYLCGAESFVKKMKRQVFMNGAAMSDIYSDSFLAGSA